MCVEYRHQEIFGKENVLLSIRQTIVFTCSPVTWSRASHGPEERSFCRYSSSGASTHGRTGDSHVLRKVFAISNRQFRAGRFARRSFYATRRFARDQRLIG